MSPKACAQTLFRRIAPPRIAMFPRYSFRPVRLTGA
jgi:hypothetical protein